MAAPVDSNWADAFQNVLSETSKNKAFKRKSQQVQRFRRHTSEKSDQEDQRTLSKAEASRRRKARAAWESKGRVKPESVLDVKERELTRIATRGVVQLFNAVQKHKQSVKSTSADNDDKREILKAADKGAFMDLLHPKRKNANLSKSSFLREDFMLGAKMKDWNKEENSDL